MLALLVRSIKRIYIMELIVGSLVAALLILVGHFFSWTETLRGPRG